MSRHLSEALPKPFHNNDTHNPHQAGANHHSVLRGLLKLGRFRKGEREHSSHTKWISPISTTHVQKICHTYK